MDVLKAMEILRKNYHCTIATASTSGQPWVSPVFFNYDDALRLVFESAHDSRHARLIAANPAVAIVVADLAHRGSPAGFYFECTAREVPEPELERAIAVFLHGPHHKDLSRTRDDYLGDKPLRLYECIPHAMYGLTQTETPEGYVIDARVELPLPASGQPR